LEYIASGQLKAGDKIPAERKLAELLNVSRASLREALSYLEISGFLKTVP
jgi:GntR family transcriptional repressor for pyruvate dehydrogenase complex